MQILQRKRSAHPLRHYAMQQNERNTALYEAILRLNTLDECIRFFDDLCAVTELNYGTGSVAESVREDLAAQGIATEK